MNKQLDRMYARLSVSVARSGKADRWCRGYNIGTRLVEDFLARTNLGRCRDLRDTAEVLSKVGFKIFLNVTPTVTNWAADGRAFSLILDDNPLAGMWRKFTLGSRELMVC